MPGGQQSRAASAPQADANPGPELQAGAGPSASSTPGSQDLPFPQLSPRLFIRATGGNLKLRFVAALLFLAVIPAFAVALLYQRAEQSNLAAVGQDSLLAVAHADATALTQEFTDVQATAQQLAHQQAIIQLSQAASPPAALSRGEALLSDALLSSPAVLDWIVVNQDDEIVVASQPALEGKPLGAASVLKNPQPLESFLRRQRSQPAKAQVSVADGQDAAIAGGWAALLAFVKPTNPAHSGAVLAVLSIRQMAQPFLSTITADPKSYALLVDAQGVLLSVQNNRPLAAQIGQPLTQGIPLQALISPSSSGTAGNPLVYQDATTGAQEQAASAPVGTWGWHALVAASPDAFGQVASGLLAPRNAPLIFLSVVVVTVLVATWVALPIVRPIRRATRDILATTDEVRVLAARAAQLTEDQRQGAAILDAAANGLHLRRTNIKRDAGLADRQIAKAAEALVGLGHLITDTPDPRRLQFQQLAIEIHRLLEEAHVNTAGIVSGLSDESAQTQLSEVRAGTREILDQFAEASQRLNDGVEQLERAAEVLL